MAKSTRRHGGPQNPSATNARNFRTFLLMQQFAAQEIGGRIAQARKEADGMTQEQLAELLNVSTRSIQDYESGSTMPWKHFSRLETIFNRPMGWFLYGDEAEEKQAAVLASQAEQLDRIERVLEELAARLDPDEAESARS